MIYDYLIITNDRKGVDVRIFCEEKALIQSVSFGLIIGCNFETPMEGECLISSWAYDDPSHSCHPVKEHLIVIKRVFRYLCGSKYYAICYQEKPGVDSEVDVHGFVDAD
jgi:hypothetical protein